MAKFEKLPRGTKLSVGSHQVTIVEYLSEGGFAHIYKVTFEPETNGNTIGCLKRVIVPDKSGLNLLRKEVDVMKTLRHGSNIVTYYDSHAERLENGTYQVLVLMELCPNKSLLDYMNANIKTKLSEAQILAIMYDISQGIYEMHKLKLIHRDIKIENVLIDAHHHFKLCDFGSTSAPIMPPADQNQFQLLSHDILYQTTPQYRSPEMIDLYRGFPIDEKSDIWALGCFLYKLCYYTTPFEANGDIAILHALFHFPQQPQYSGDLKNLIIIMLQENPLFRPNIYQVLMLLTKMLRIDAKDSEIEDFYNIGPYNFQVLHDYQRHKQHEMAKQQQLYLQQQGFSKTPSAVSLPQKETISRSHTPQPKSSSQYNEKVPYDAQTSHQQHSKSSNNLTVSRSTEVYANTNNILSRATLDPYERHDEESLVSARSSVSATSVPHQNSSNYPENTGSDLENLDNVEERYPSLEDILDAPSSRQASSNLDTISGKSAQNVEYPASDIVVNKGHYSPYIDPAFKVADSKRDSKREFNRKEAWERLETNLNHEAVKLVDDIFSSSDPKTKQSSEQALNKTSVKSFDENHLQAEDQIYLDSDMDEYSKTIDDKFPDICETSVPNIVLDDQVEPEVLPAKKVSPEIASSQEPRRPVSSNASPILGPQAIGNQSPAVAALNFPLPPRVPLSLSSKAMPLASYDNYQFNSTKKNPFPYPPASNILSPGNNVICEPKDENRKQGNPWGDFRKNESLPQSPPQAYNPNESPTIQMQEQFASLLAFSKPVTCEAANLPQDQGSFAKPISSVSRDETPYEKKEDPELNNYLGSLTLNEANTKLRSKSGDEGKTSKVNKEPVHKRIQSLDAHQLNLIDLDIGDESDGSIATPVLRKTIRDEEPSLLDLDSPEGKKQDVMPHYKKRISSIQDQKWEEEVIDFESDDEDPVKKSRMSRLSIRDSLKKPKRRSGEYRRSDGSEDHRY